MRRRTFMQSVGGTILAGTTLGATDGSGTSQDLPNILWLMADEQRTDSLGCYGSTWA